MQCFYARQLLAIVRSLPPTERGTIVTSPRQFDAEENPLTIEAVESLSVERRNHYASLVEGFPGTGEVELHVASPEN